MLGKNLPTNFDSRDFCGAGQKTRTDIFGNVIDA